MKCPLLNTWDIPTCLSEGGILIPSIAELKAYCSTENHAQCPVFRKQPLEKNSWLPFCGNTSRSVAA